MLYIAVWHSLTQPLTSCTETRNNSVTGLSVVTLDAHVGDEIGGG